MNIKRLFILTGTVFLGLTLVSMWMWFLSGPSDLAQAAGPRYVAPSGSDSNSCLSTTAPCTINNEANGSIHYVCAGTGLSDNSASRMIDGPAGDDSTGQEAGPTCINSG